MALFHDPSFWVDAAFVLLCVFLFVKAKPRVKEVLDARIETIARELDEARDAREQASRELAEVMFRDKNAEREIEQIEEQAKEESATLRRESELEREQSLRRVRQFAEERLLEMEARWRAHAQASFVSVVLGASERALRQPLKDSKVQSLLFARALRRLPTDKMG